MECEQSRVEEDRREVLQLFGIVCVSAVLFFAGEMACLVGSRRRGGQRLQHLYGGRNKTGGHGCRRDRSRNRGWSPCLSRRADSSVEVPAGVAKAHFHLRSFSQHSHSSLLEIIFDRLSVQFRKRPSANAWLVDAPTILLSKCRWSCKAFSEAGERQF